MIGSLLMLLSLAANGLEIPAVSPADRDNGQTPVPAFQLWVSTEMHFSNRHGGGSSGAAFDLALQVKDHRITYSTANNCGFAAGALKDFDNTASVGWWVEATPTALTHEHAVVALKWYRAITNGARAATMAHETSVLLRPGDEMRLDTLVLPTRESSCANPTATLYISLRQKEPQRERVVETDVWLVHRTADGKESAQQHSTRSNFAETVPFFFDEVRVAGLVLDVFGEVTPRSRPDGSITLEFSAQREVFDVGRQGGGGPNHAYFGSGASALVFRPDDVVSFEIPMTPWPALSGDSFTLRVRTRQIR